MSDLFGALAARALGAATNIMPRVPSRFEPTEPAAPAQDGDLGIAFDDRPVSRMRGTASDAGVTSASPAAGDASPRGDVAPDRAMPLRRDDAELHAAAPALEPAAPPFAVSSADEPDLPASATPAHDVYAATVREPRDAHAQSAPLRSRSADDANGARDTLSARAASDRGDVRSTVPRTAHAEAVPAAMSSPAAERASHPGAHETAAVPPLHDATATPARRDASATPPRHDASATPGRFDASATPGRFDASAMPATAAPAGAVVQARGEVVPPHGETGSPRASSARETPVREPLDAAGPAAAGAIITRPQAPVPETRTARVPERRAENVPSWSVRPELDAVSTRARRDDGAQPLGDPDPATVHVHIGRVDVRMLPAPAAPVRTRRKAPEPALELDEYLRNRGRPAR